MNIFKDAYFGKFYKTRDGRKAIFLESYEVIVFGKERTCVKCIIQEEPDFYFYELDGLNFYGGYAIDENGNIEYWNTDIISEYKEEINEEKLEKFAFEESL